jgi:act minimal PKS chain-length factor (CLF/KS beta)
MSLALDRAGLDPAQIDVVFADGAGTPDGDLAEARALGQVFGSRQLPVTVPKTMVGRLYAGGAALDVATVALAMRDGLVPPTVNVSTLADGCALDLVRAEARAMPVGYALVSARGSGGFNSAMVLANGATVR